MKGKKQIIEKRNIAIAIIELIIILTIIIGIPVYIYISQPELVESFKSMEKFEAFMQQYSEESIPIYLVCQIVQVVVTFLPGQVIQVAGGYLYGFFWAMVISLIGITIGSAISFAIARIFGKRPMKMLFGEERFEKYNRLLDTKKAHKIIFILYFIPGLPKDMVAYAAGVSKMQFTAFIIISTAGRIPAMAVSVIFGVMLESHSYTGAVILAVCVAVICIICFIKKDSLIDFSDKYYNRINK